MKHSRCPVSPTVEAAGWPSLHKKEIVFMAIETLEELLIEELRDLYDAEKQLVKALPKMAKAATSEELRTAFEEHLEQTKGQVTRIERVFETFDEKAKSKPCKAMKGLLEEGKEVMDEDALEQFTDLALIGAAQKVEHYEISGYGTARTMAETLGNSEAARLLEETLKEEETTDKRLTEIAKEILEEANNISAESEDEDAEEMEEEDVEA
jgi:ferritin-like metal-binding protein YciE